MTLYAQDNLPIVLHERFEELNVSVKCKDDDDGTLVLTFDSKDAFDYAKQQWGYVNEADDGNPSISMPLDQAETTVSEPFIPAAAYPILHLCTALPDHLASTTVPPLHWQDLRPQ